MAWWTSSDPNVGIRAALAEALGCDEKTLRQDAALVDVDGVDE